MSLIETVKLAFTGVPSPKRDAAKSRARLKQAVASRSHGSIRLQLGLFYTKEEAERRYERARAIKFDN